MASIIFYGAGENAKKNLNKWAKAGLVPVCFVDSDVCKQHQMFPATICDESNRYEVLSLLEAVNKYPDYELYLTQISSSLSTVRNFLVGLGIPNERIKFCSDALIASGYYETNNMVKSCEALERGIAFLYDGICCCCPPMFHSNALVTLDELNGNPDWSGKEWVDLIVARRKKLFEAVNSEDDSQKGYCSKCKFLKSKPLDEVDFTYLGGIERGEVNSFFSIQYNSLCNLRCTYCGHTKTKAFAPCKYDENIVMQIINEFVRRDKVKFSNHIELNCGELTIQKSFDDVMYALTKAKVGIVSMFTNGTVFKQSLYDAFKLRLANIVTSIDSGTVETYKKIHGKDKFHDVIFNLIKYRTSGNNDMILKYIICDDESNISFEDLCGFILVVLLVRPLRVAITPEYRKPDKSVPEPVIRFGAQMCYLFERIMGISIMFYSDGFSTMPAMVNYSADVRLTIENMAVSEKDALYNDAMELIRNYVVNYIR